MGLDPRKRALLGAIVGSYVEHAEPVASEWLAAASNLGVRSATIRNELAEMTEMGYLRQPHVSAGRVPSTRGYRYFVDHLMTPVRLPSDAERNLRGVQRLNEGDVEQLLLQTCRLLSSLTGYTSVAAPPTGQEERIRSAHIVQMDGRHALVVVVLESGRVIHRISPLGRPLAPADVNRLSSALDELLRGTSASAGVPRVALPPALAPLEDLLRALLRVVAAALEGQSHEAYVEGTTHLFEQPEFREADRVEPLVQLLEERRSLYEQLQRLLTAGQVAVVIGDENPHAALQECSVVLAHYRAGDRMAGWVGVVGPTRLRYERTVPAVHFAARALSDVFHRIGLA